MLRLTLCALMLIALPAGAACQFSPALELMHSSALRIDGVPESTVVTELSTAAQARRMEFAVDTHPGLTPEQMPVVRVTANIQAGLRTRDVMVIVGNPFDPTLFRVRSYDPRPDDPRNDPEVTETHAYIVGRLKGLGGRIEPMQRG